MFTPKFGKLILERKRSADDVKSEKVFELRDIYEPAKKYYLINLRET